MRPEAMAGAKPKVMNTWPSMTTTMAAAAVP
jgi:hypothetical protein